MKSIWWMMIIAVSMGLVVMPARAESGDGVKVKKEKKVKAPKAPKPPKAMKGDKVKADKPKPVLVELVLTGTIAKQEKKGKEDKVMVKYILTDASGNKTPLPTPKKARKKKGEAAPEAINLDDYLDTGVTVTGMGTKVEKNGKSMIRLKSITRIVTGADMDDIDVFPSAAEE